MHPYKPYVPVDLLLPYIEEFLETNSLTTLQRDTGINVRTISDLRHGRRERVRFTTADQLLTGLGLIDAWREDEALAPYYAMAV